MQQLLDWEQTPAQEPAQEPPSWLSKTAAWISDFAETTADVFSEAMLDLSLN